MEKARIVTAEMTPALQGKMAKWSNGEMVKW